MRIICVCVREEGCIDEAKEIWISKVIGDVEHNEDGTVLRSCRLHFLGDGLFVLSDFGSKMVT